MSSDPNTPSLGELEACFVNNAEFERVGAYLNRFNPIRVMRMEGMEIRHSAILAWLLDPVETHGFGDKFLRAFLAEALRGGGNTKPTAIELTQANLRDAEIHREKQSVDLFVASPSNGWAFIIENKFHSKQSKGQLKRYLDQAKVNAKEMGKELINRGIFLTLHDEEPAEESYVTLRYADICTILAALLTANAQNMGPEVYQFLNHYLEVIRDAAEMNEDQKEMEALAKQLYRSHKKVLDFIMDHGASTEFTLAAESTFGSDLKYGDEFKFEGARYMFSGNNDRQFSFLPVIWRDPLGGEDKKALWEGCETWWARYPLICWFQLIDGGDGVRGTLRLFTELGPYSNSEHRKWLVESIQNAAKQQGLSTIQFRTDATKPTARYSKYFKGNVVSINDVSDAEEIAAGMKKLLKKFTPSFDVVSTVLPEFVERLEVQDD